MLSINKLTILYGPKTLFNEVSTRVLKNDRIGLVGTNGSGKTTLLRIMAGEQECDDNVVTRAKYTTVGYLPQEITAFPSGTSLYDEAKTAFAGVLALQREMEEVNTNLANTDHDAPEFQALLELHGHLQHQLDDSDIFRMQSQIEKVLMGLGFKEKDFGRPCEEFSGGWLMRLMLAKQLLARPTLLLLDEPTNHLDIESVTWLEEFLQSYQGALLIISHDRTFLDAITTSTWEISLGNLTAYKGNYTAFVKEKAMRMEIRQAAYNNQQAQIQQTMRFVTRFRSKSTKAAQVQSRLRQLDKMEKIEIESSEQSVAFRFPPAPPSGKLAVAITNLVKKYDEETIFSGVNFELHRGDKLAVVGVNGAGKSTLARIIAQQETLNSGEVRLGHNVKLGYFGQHQARELDPQYTALETLSHATEDMTLTAQRSLLGAFLFRGDDVDKRVAVLSGGEKSRLALARMMATPANFLVMDEPTNHLDMSSQEVLQEAMRQYDGTIIIVSHNRFFLDQFVNRVLEIRDGVATLHEGNLSDYLARLKKLEQQKPVAAATPQKEVAGSAQRGKEKRQAEAQLRQEKSRLLGPLRKTALQEEKEIENLEARKAELETLLADPELYSNNEAFAKASKEYSQVERRLERTMTNWEEAQGKIEEIEARLERENDEL